MASKTSSKIDSAESDSQAKGTVSGDTQSGSHSSEKKPAKPKSKERTRWWFVLAGVAVVVVLVGFFAPRAIRNYCVYQGETQLTLRNYDEALSWLDNAAAISPEDGEIEFLKARVYRKTGDFTAFDKSLQEAKRLDYDRERCRREEWLKEAQQGNFKDAGANLKELLDDQYGDSAEVAEAFVSGYILIGRLADALEFLDPWSEDYPDDPQPKFLMGIIEKRYGRRDKASDLFREALKLQPDHYQSMMALADTLEVDREFEEAIVMYEKARESDAFKQQAMARLGSCLRQTGEIDRAKKVLDEAYELDSNHATTLIELARVEIVLEEFDSAIKHFETVLEEGKFVETSVYGSYADALRGAGRVEEAAVQAEYAAEATDMMAKAGTLIRELGADTQDLESRVQIGRIIVRYGEEQQGLAWLFSTLDIDPNYPPAHAALAEHYFRKAEKNPDFLEAAQTHFGASGNLQLPPLK